jgi:predicted Zn-dependent protease
VVTQALTEGYSQDKESEADRKGTEFAASTGYDPNGLKNFLETMKQAASQDPDAKRKTGLYSGSTHPTFDQRIAALTPVASQFQGGVTNEDRFKRNASFGPSAAELAAQKKAEEEAAAKKAAEEKAAAAAASKAKPRAKAAGKKQ